MSYESNDLFDILTQENFDIEQYRQPQETLHPHIDIFDKAENALTKLDTLAPLRLQEMLGHGLDSNVDSDGLWQGKVHRQQRYQG